LALKIDGARLTFKIAADADIVVVVPPASTAQMVADLLASRVLDGGARKLAVEQAAVGELQTRLPFPATFSDPGDGQASIADHDAHRDDPITISTSAAPTSGGCSSRVVRARNAPRWETRSVAARRSVPSSSTMPTATRCSSAGDGSRPGARSRGSRPIPRRTRPRHDLHRTRHPTA